MLLPRFSLERPRTVEEAIALLAAGGEDVSLYAGGTELLLAMKHRVLRYATLIDVKGIPRLAEIVLGPEGDLTIGALATHHAIERHPLVRARAPAYAELSRHVGNIRVRVAGTIGGNLCFAEPHADPPTLLAALDARLTLVGPAGSRSVSIQKFLAGAFETTRGPAEILTGITVPARSADHRVAYERFGHLERPTIAVAAVLAPEAESRTLAGASIWMGAVGPKPFRVRAMEERLGGVQRRELPGALPEMASAAAETVPVDADLHGSEDYKRHLAGVLLRRVVEKALGATHGR